MAFPNGDQDQPFSYAKLFNKPFPVPSHLGPSSYNALAQAPIVQSQAPQLVWDDFDTSLPNGGIAASNHVNDNDSLVGYSTLVQQLLTQPEHITSPGTGGEYNAPPFDQGTTALLPQTSGSQTPYNPGPLPRFPITRLKPRAGTVSSVQSDSIVPNSIVDQAIKAYIAATPGATASFPLEQLESYFVKYRFTPSQLPAQYLTPNKKIRPNLLPLELAAYWIDLKMRKFFYWHMSVVRNALMARRNHDGQQHAGQSASIYITPFKLSKKPIDSKLKAGYFGYFLYWDSARGTFITSIPATGQSLSSQEWSSIQAIEKQPFSFVMFYSVAITKFHVVAKSLLQSHLDKLTNDEADFMIDKT
ncbi:hypothetical protein H4R35_002957 [Dimargaris xerosporica]|nr:hypothetical protein H4R35_002957 [Dimargaris xerosporica]